MKSARAMSFWTNNHRGFAYLVLLAGTALAMSCGGGRQIKISNPVARIGASEEGVASWYGEPYHGRRAANGEVYNMHAMTAAHPSLPFETWVAVRNLDNRKSTQVRITDRGPFVKGRIVDLSRAAAEEIDLVRLGIAKVKLTVIDPPRSYLRGRQFTVQVTTARTPQNAQFLERKLKSKYKDVFVRYRPAVAKGNTPESWRILVGRVDDVKQAQKTLLEVRPDYPNSFVVGWDVE
jgi:rare lipoprotein A